MSFSRLRVQLQVLGSGHLAQMRDRDLARVERQHRTAYARRRDRQVAHAAAEVQHLTMKVFQRRLPERVQREVGFLDLTLELPIEEFDTSVVAPLLEERC